MGVTEIKGRGETERHDRVTIIIMSDLWGPSLKFCPAPKEFCWRPWVSYPYEFIIDHSETLLVHLQLLSNGLSLLCQAENTNTLKNPQEKNEFPFGM
ncbi:hypothetical protein FKM82_000891 [Ascaphus truei]